VEHYIASYLKKLISSELYTLSMIYDIITDTLNLGFNKMKFTINSIKNILGTALQEIDNPCISHDTKIHSIRVMSKKLRSILYLIKPFLKNKEFFQNQNTFYKELSKAFSQEREKKVMNDTFRWIIQKCKLSTDMTIVIQNALKENIANNIITDKNIDTKIQICRESILVAVSDLHIFKNYTRQDLKLGSKQTYQKAYNSLIIAILTQNIEDIHLFRKYAKYYMYQLQLLQNQIKHAKKRAKDLDKLTSMLGRIHDLSLFNDYLQDNKNLTNSDMLISCIDKIQKKLTKKAFKLAIKIFK